MAGSEFDGMWDGFNVLGEFISGLFKSENTLALYFVVLLLMTVVIWSILKVILSKVPIFKGEGDATLNAPGNIIAWCISLLTIISIGWQMREKGGPEYMIEALTGPYGNIVMFAAMIILAYSTYQGMEDQDKWSRILYSFGPALAIYFWFTSYSARGMSPVAFLFAFFLLVIFIIGIFQKVKGDYY